MSRDASWFARTFEAGNRRRSVDPVQDPSPESVSDPHDNRAGTGGVDGMNDRELEHTRLLAKAEALTAAVVMASGYEKRGATAGVVRFALQGRAQDAWNRLDAHKYSPLSEAEAQPSGSAPASESGDPQGGTHGASPRPGLAAPLPDDAAAGPSPLLQQAEARLRLIAEAVAELVDKLEAADVRVILGDAPVDFLRTIQACAEGRNRIRPITPRLLDPPELRLVGDE